MQSKDSIEAEDARDEGLLSSEEPLPPPSRYEGFPDEERFSPSPSKLSEKREDLAALIEHAPRELGFPSEESTLHELIRKPLPGTSNFAMETHPSPLSSLLQSPNDERPQFASPPAVHSLHLPSHQVSSPETRVSPRSTQQQESSREEHPPLSSVSRRSQSSESPRIEYNPLSPVKYTFRNFSIDTKEAAVPQSSEENPQVKEDEKDNPEPISIPPLPIATVGVSDVSFVRMKTMQEIEKRRNEGNSANLVPIADTGVIDELSEDVNSLLVDLHRNVVQTGGRITGNFKARIALLVSQFAVRAHNLPVPQVKSKVKMQIQPGERSPTRRADQLAALNQAIDRFSLKVAVNLKRIKHAKPLTELVAQAFLELVKEVGQVNTLLHPNRTPWEVFHAFLQQPGNAVNTVRSIPKQIRERVISRSKFHAEQYETVKILLSDVASVDLYDVDATGATMLLWDVVNSSLDYYQHVHRAGKDEKEKDKVEHVKLSKKMMSSHGKLIAKMLTRNREIKTFSPLRGTSNIDDEVPEPEPMLAHPHPQELNLLV